MDLGAIILAISPVVIAISAATTLLCNVLGPWARRTFTKPRCRIIPLDRFGVSHYLGNLKIYLSIDIQNISYPKVLITRLVCTVSGIDVAYSIELPSYYMGERDVPYLFRSISLASQEHWGGGVIFFRAWSDTDDAEVASIISDVTSTRNANIQAGIPFNQAGADKNGVIHGMKFFSDHFRLNIGNYRLKIVALSADEKPVAGEECEFTLYHHHLEQLKAPTQQYKFGNFGDFVQGVSVQLRPLSR